MSEFALSQVQAQAILDMRLQRLTNLQVMELRREYDEVCKLMEELRAILDSPKKLISVIKREMLQIKKQYAGARKTQIVGGDAEIVVDENDLKVVTDMTVYMTPAGMKRMPSKLYAAKGPQEEGRILFQLDTQSDQRLQFFTNLGTMYSLDVEEIPEWKPRERACCPPAVPGVAGTGGGDPCGI